MHVSEDGIWLVLYPTSRHCWRPDLETHFWLMLSPLSGGDHEGLFSANHVKYFLSMTCWSSPREVRMAWAHTLSRAAARVLCWPGMEWCGESHSQSKAHLSTLHASVALLAGMRVGKAKSHFFIVLLCPVLATLGSRTAALAPLCASQTPL